MARRYYVQLRYSMAHGGLGRRLRARSDRRETPGADALQDPAWKVEVNAPVTWLDRLAYLMFFLVLVAMAFLEAR